MNSLVRIRVAYILSITYFKKLSKYFVLKVLVLSVI